MTRPTAIFCDGPLSTTNRDGDEVPEWSVFAGDDDACEIGPISYFDDYDAAVDAARRQARETRLPLENCATPA